MTWPQYQRGECTVSGAVALSPLEAEALFVLLVRHPEMVSAGDLIDALYPDPDAEPEDAENALACVIGRLRNAVGAGRIVTHPGGYALAA